MSMPGRPNFLDLDVNAGKTQLLLLKSIKNVIGNDSSHSVKLSGELELLDEGGTDDGGGGAADAGLAVGDDGAGGGGVLQHGHDLVKVCFLRSFLLVHGDADWLQLGDLVLDGPIDLVEGCHTGELLRQLFVASSLLGVLSKLIFEILEIFSTLFDFFSEIIFHGSAFLWVVDLQVEVDRVAVDSYGSEGIGWVPGSVGLAINIDNWFLSEVHPEDVLLISILLQDRFKTLLEPLNRGLAGAKKRESRKPSEVWCPICPGCSLCKSVNPFEGIGHGLEFAGWWRHLELLIFRRVVSTGVTCTATKCTRIPCLVAR